MSTIRVNAIQDIAGVERYTARAWVNFNGTGTVAIRASGNVSSVTDNGVGQYTINFTTAMADANYAAAVTAGDGLSTSKGTRSPGLTPTASSFQVQTTNGGQTAFEDASYVLASFFR